MDVGEVPFSLVCFSQLHVSFTREDQARNIPDLHSSQPICTLGEVPPWHSPREMLSPAMNTKLNLLPKMCWVISVHLHVQTLYWTKI